MKKIVFILFFLPVIASAQDSIAIKGQATLAAEILYVDMASIHYKKYSHLSGPVYIAERSTVSYIRYQEGKKENIDSLYKLEQFTDKEKDSVSMYKRGKHDARVFYRGNTGALLTGITSAALGPGGLVPAIICSSRRPNVYHLNYPDTLLWENPHYQQGYVHKAKNKKQLKVWSSFAVGFSVFLAAVLYFGQP